MIDRILEKYPMFEKAQYPNDIRFRKSKNVVDHIRMIEESDSFIHDAVSLLDLGLLKINKTYFGMSVYLALEFMEENHERFVKFISEFQIGLELLVFSGISKFKQRYFMENQLQKDIVNASKHFNIVLPESIIETINSDSDDFNLHFGHEESVNILVGPQCVGKSSFYHNIPEPYMVCSSDNATEAIGRKYGYNTFDEAVDNQTDDMKVEVNNYENAELDKALEYEGNIIADNINFREKYRKFWLQKEKTHTIKVFIFLRPYDDILACAKKRGIEEGKTIRERTVINKIKRFELPLYSSGYDDIEFILV